MSAAELFGALSDEYQLDGVLSDASGDDDRTEVARSLQQIAVDEADEKADAVVEN